jgi:hypothetical protein
MDDLDRTQLEQVLKLTKENNHMLRSMRRNALLGGLFKLVFWAALIILPFWLYMQYLAPVVNSTLEAMQKVQGTSAEAQAQFGSLTESLQKLQAQFPQYFQGQ